MGGGGGELYQYCTSTLIALGLCPSRGRLVNPACLSEIIWRSESCHSWSLSSGLVAGCSDFGVRITCQCTYSHTHAHTQRCIKEASDWRADYDRSILILMLSRGIRVLKGIRQRVCTVRTTVTRRIHSHGSAAGAQSVTAVEKL